MNLYILSLMGSRISGFRSVRFSLVRWISVLCFNTLIFKFVSHCATVAVFVGMRIYISEVASLPCIAG